VLQRSPFLVVVLFAAFAAAASVSGRPTSAAGTPAADGKAIYLANCAACHQAAGIGGGPYPPLAGNADVTAADTANLILTVLNGRSGPIKVGTKTFSGTMPAWKDRLSDGDVAAVITYIRSAWNNGAAVVSPAQVAVARNPSALSGAQIFAVKCAACHQAGGQGTSAYPPLNGNPHVAGGDPREMIATIVNGRSGPLVVNGTTYNGKMPAWKGQLSNADIAAVATYVRSAWTNAASGVTEQLVAAAGTPVLSAVGASVYASKCAVCHGAGGQGGGHGQFPPLAGDALVNGSDPTAMIAVMEHGRSMMPSWKGQLSPGDLAAVATYVRAAWGNKGGPVSEQDVNAVK
jgi:cbb3-type cytochrome c oxidase subunit III